VIVMFFIGNFIANSLVEIADSNAEWRFQEDFVNFNGVLNNYRNIFLTGSILIDNTGTGSDILILTNFDKSAGIILWVVDKGTMQVEYIESEYNRYYDKVIWYRDLSASEIVELESDPTQVQHYSFFSDKLFDEIKVVDFQLEFYNNGEVIDVNMEVNKDYKSDLNGTSMSDLELNIIKKYNLNF
jgi:hypothetical protein